MSPLKSAILDNSVFAPLVLASPSRRRFPIGSAGIAAAAGLPAAMMAAPSEQANASTPSNPLQPAQGKTHNEYVHNHPVNSSRCPHARARPTAVDRALQNNPERADKPG